MVRKIIFFCAIVCFCFAGCSTPDKDGHNASIKQRAGSAGDMIEYLQRKNLPEVESISDWANRYGEGLIITTRHYRIYTTLLDGGMLKQLGCFMESAYKNYQRHLPSPVIAVGKPARGKAGKFPVYLFADRCQWEDFTRRFTGVQAPAYIKIRAGAYYLKGSCVAYNIGSERTFRVLGHEGWHQFSDNHFKFRLPGWLDEGIAMQFEAYRYRKGEFHFDKKENRYRLGGLKKVLAGYEMIPLRELVGMNPGEVLATYEHDVYGSDIDRVESLLAFYSQSYGLVRFLQEAEHGKRLYRYQQLLVDGLEGNWKIESIEKKIAADKDLRPSVKWNQAVGSQLFRQYIGDDFERLDEEYVRFCREIAQRVK